MHNVARRDQFRFFIVTRAVLGVCRTLLEEPEDMLPPVSELDDQLVGLVEAYS
jgi:hypothetical protein